MEPNLIEQKPTEPSKASPYTIPAAIVVAGVLIAGAVFYSSSPKETTPTKPAEKPLTSLVVSPILASEHILGDKNAKVTIIEFSDTECPYCQSFMPTLKKIMNEYGKTGEVAWVYRHFAVHPKVPYEAQATECSAELGGNDKFWRYLDLLFSKKDFYQQPYTGVDPKDLPKLASSIGIDIDEFTKCLKSEKYKEKVDGQYKEAVSLGGRGTPFSVIELQTALSKDTITKLDTTYDSIRDQEGNRLIKFTEDGLHISVSGAMPYEVMKNIVDSALGKN